MITSCLYIILSERHGIPFISSELHKNRIGAVKNSIGAENIDFPDKYVKV